MTRLPGARRTSYVPSCQQTSDERLDEATLAATALHDEMAITMSDDDPEEARFVTLGADALGRILVVVYTWRDTGPRLISARRATPSERRQYEGKRR